MLLFGGEVMFRSPLLAVKFRPTRRWSISNECVTEPARTKTAEEILAASGVCTWKAAP